MAKVFDEITDHIRAWIGKQPLFFVATAPLDSDAYVTWLTNVLDALSVDRASLVGISVRPIGPRARHAQGPRRRTLRHGRR